MVANAPRFVAFSLVDRAPFLADADAVNLLGRAREAVASGRGHHPRTEVLDCLSEATDVLHNAVPLDVARSKFAAVFRGKADGGRHATELLVDNPRGCPMTPASYLDLIVLPTFREFLDEPTNQRRAYLACITAAHLVDHVAVTLPRHHGAKPDIQEVRAALGRLGSGTAAALEIVEAVCNGTKHAQADPKKSRPVKFAPGYERFIPGSAFNIEDAGLDRGRWDSPGLVVDHGGVAWPLDDCIAGTVRGHVAAFPDRFIGVDDHHRGAGARPLRMANLADAAEHRSMTPADFAREIVIPTLEDFRAARTSRRWAYLSAIAVHHLRDHLAEALTPSTGDPKADRKAVEHEADRVDAAVVAALSSAEPFEAVRAIANGSKHALTRSVRGVAFTAGSDWRRPPASCGTFQFGVSRFGDFTGGREIPHEGRRLDMYPATAAVFLAFVAAFPAQLGECAFDPYPAKL